MIRLQDPELYLQERTDITVIIDEIQRTVAQQDLGNPLMIVVTPSADDFNMSENVLVCSISTLSDHLNKSF